MYENIDFTTTRGSEISQDIGEETVQTPDSSTHLDAGLSLQGAETEKPPLDVQGKPYSTVLLMFAALLQENLKHKDHYWCQNQAQENQNQSMKEWQELRESHFYYASTERKNWTESSKDCKSRGGDLVVLNYLEKQEMIRRLKIHGDSWIGLQTSNEWTVKWKWVDGSNLESSSWKKDIKVITEPGLKAFTDQEGQWMFNKTGLKYWICEKRNVQYVGDLKPGKNINKN
ncbi:C-type lectin domain family 10 member A-like isoform X2 [Gambusia affinis]|uniref:C-type lectin domain family 10 member A-like isoform X2 n=1 Tax=Gambusia affinis TaxID=33528 RepID=UPI001CDCE34D|nr:C-type lectin domain family 10 member A-like isoform X2 [Gambusia affinis]